MKIRKWIAWKLVCAADRIYSTDYEQHVVVTDQGVEIFEASVTADDYGRGIHALHHVSSPQVNGDDVFVSFGETTIRVVNF